ncbi:MAG: hypothetical protein MJ147_08270 [Clostridia bacterium]|nr:hypothetical protein [Clostridia bacterium]
MKRIFSVFLCGIMLLPCLCLQTWAAKSKTVLYLNYGNITIGEYSITGYDENKQQITEVNRAGYIITQSNPNTKIDKGITINSASCEIELLNLNIKRASEYNCALAVQKSSDVTITVTGENHLVSGSSRAGVEVATNSRATINGDGILYAESALQAGIGGGNGQSNGTVVINSGTIYATGGIDGYSAGIGGGSSGKGGNITINGGFVCATGGLYAAGIGGGFMCGGGNITINGGVVTATGDDYGAGIGSGYMAGSATNIVINGGSVKGIGGKDASDIGDGAKPKTMCSAICNSEGNEVSPVKFTPDNFSQIFIDGIDNQPIEKIHPDDDSLYIYTDSSAKFITEYLQDGSSKFFSINSEKTEQFSPYKNCEKFFDKLIVGGDKNISVSDGFTVENQTDLMYNSMRVDSFQIAVRGDLDFDGKFDGMDAVICGCVANGMVGDMLLVKLADTDGNGTVNEDDANTLLLCGLGGI